MTVCDSCGTQVQDGMNLCPTCGKAVAPQGQAFATAASPAKDAEDNKLMAVLSYIIFFIPLLAGEHKKSPFVKFHVNQGTVLFVTMIAWGIVYGILSAIITALLFNPLSWSGAGVGIYGIVTTILSLVWLIPSILSIMGIVGAVTGKTKPLPLIGKFKIIK
jgi:uncharacterized membrane protein